MPLIMQRQSIMSATSRVCSGLIFALLAPLGCSKAFAADASRLVLPATPRPGLTLHVAPSGNDAAHGAADQPYATLERARDAIRSLKSKGELPGGGVVVLVHGGEYAVARPFTLNAEDSGTDKGPIVLRAAPGENPRFRGGVRLKNWQPLQDAVAMNRIPEAARAQVWQCDLTAAAPGVSLLPLELGGFASGNGFRTHPAHELFFNGKAMQLARGPNEGFLRIADVAVKDGTKGYDRQGSKIGEFIFSDDRPKAWVGEPDLLLYGYWF